MVVVISKVTGTAGIVQITTVTEMWLWLWTWVILPLLLVVAVPWIRRNVNNEHLAKLCRE